MTKSLLKKDTETKLEKLRFPYSLIHAPSSLQRRLFVLLKAPWQWHNLSNTCTKLTNKNEILFSKKSICLIFKSFHIVPKSLVMSIHLSVRLSIDLSACIRAFSTGRISTKFSIGDSYENLSRKSKCLWNRIKISRTLTENLSTIYCCWWY